MFSCFPDVVVVNQCRQTALTLGEFLKNRKHTNTGVRSACHGNCEHSSCLLRLLVDQVVQNTQVSTWLQNTHCFLHPCVWANEFRLPQLAAVVDFDSICRLHVVRWVGNDHIVRIVLHRESFSSICNEGRIVCVLYVHRMLVGSASNAA